MTISLCKVANIADFKDQDFLNIFKKYDYLGTKQFPQAVENVSLQNRKTWEIAMAMYSFDTLGVINQNAEILGIGAAKEETISMLSNHVKRVFATDIYLDGGSWQHWYERELLMDARPYMGNLYNHRRVVWQHVDGRDLPYEDNSFDGIFSCSSLEHFGNESDIRKSIEEACRVLKPGGIAAISSEFKISGYGDGFANVQLFDKERIERVWVDGIDWELVEMIDYELDDTDFIDFERSISDVEYQKTAHPHIKLDNGSYKWTSVHMTFRKAE
jgi:ubiquinone/menaquinone biosynthesis C-methylase UbiE